MTGNPAFAAPLQRAVAHATAYLDALHEAPVGTRASLDTLRARFDGDLPLDGEEPTRVIDELVRNVEGGLIGSAGGRFYGWVIGGAVPAALAADWLTATWDQNAALYACSPASAVVEEVVGRWLKSLLGLPASATFAFVTGCQMAHVTCLAAARSHLLQRVGWDLERRGLAGSPPLRVLTSQERHGTCDRALRLLGVGSDQVEVLPSDRDGRLAPEILSDRLSSTPGQPCIVVLQAGEINTAAFDPFAALVPIAHAARAWVHVDGAFGLWAAASESTRHLVAGVEGADSWATDGHKWLNVPYDAGYAFVAHGAAHQRAMSHRASYLIHRDDVRDQLDYTPEWSRRARGFASWAALRSLGRRGVDDLVARCCRHADRLTRGIGALPGAQLLATSALNQGLVRFLSPGSGRTTGERVSASADAMHDRATDAVIAEVERSGEAFFTGTTWRGRRAMRISVCNWQTSDIDVERAIRAVAQAVTDVSTRFGEEERDTTP